MINAHTRSVDSRRPRFKYKLPLYVKKYNIVTLYTSQHDTESKQRAFNWHDKPSEVKINLNVDTYRLKAADSVRLQ